MALKGSATIELTNSDGTKEVIQHDNMITNAVIDLLKSYRGETCPAFKISSLGDDFVKNVFGGVLLFDETLNNNADDYFIPSTKVTGFAGQVAYSGLDIARGSCNDSESGLQDDGSYKLVWDFSTAQANGRIQSVALCPKVMGAIGMSDTIQTSEIKSNSELSPSPKEPFYSYGDLLPGRNASTTIEGITTYYFHIAAIVGDVCYAITKSDAKSLSNTHNLPLYKFKLGAENISIGCPIARAKYLGKVDVPLPSDFLVKNNDENSITYTYDATNMVLIVQPCAVSRDLAKNGTFTFIEIDLLNNFEVTKKTLTNTTPYPINMTSNYSVMSDYDALLPIYITENSAFVLSGYSNNVYYMYIINRTDNTNVKNVTYNGAPLTFLYGERIRPIYRSSKVLVFGVASSGNNGNISAIYVVDTSTGIAKKTNSNSFYSKGCIRINDAVWIKEGTYLAYTIVVNPFILCTKNNLDTAITKTASQTMKITYTLTEVAEGGV